MELFVCSIPYKSSYSEDFFSCPWLNGLYFAALKSRFI